MNDFDRFKMVLSQIVGKRLTFDQLIGKVEQIQEVELKWTPLSRPFFARNKLRFGGYSLT